MSVNAVSKAVPRSFMVSLENRKQRGRGHERPEEILTAARALFLEHGVEDVTTRQIAARVGISQTALYVYFKSKEDILDKIIAGSLCKLGKTLDAIEIDEDCPVARFKAFARTYVEFWLANSDEFRLSLMRGGPRRGAVESDSQAARIGEALYARLRARIDDAVATGSMRQLAGDNGSTQCVWAALHGLVSIRLTYPNFDWMPLEEHIDAHIGMIIGGLACCEKANSAGVLAPTQPASPTLV